jgi:apolipoprotein N-acyltransferase
MRATTDGDKYRRPWSSRRLVIAISLITLGVLCSALGLIAQLWGDPHSRGQFLAFVAWTIGPWIMIAGSLWLAMQIIVGIRRFSLGTLLIATTLIAAVLGLVAYAMRK